VSWRRDEEAERHGKAVWKIAVVDLSLTRVLPTRNALDQHACACDFGVGGLCDSDDGYEQPSVLYHLVRPGVSLRLTADGSSTRRGRCPVDTGQLVSVPGDVRVETTSGSPIVTKVSNRQQEHPHAIRTSDTSPASLVCCSLLIGPNDQAKCSEADPRPVTSSIRDRKVKGSTMCMHFDVQIREVDYFTAA
jgi:hypothetical protein